MEMASPQQVQISCSIQEMVKNPIHEIPSKFLVNPEPAAAQIANPNFTSSSSPLPVVDMAALVQEHDKMMRSSHLDNLHSICKEWGVFQLVNHGVETSILEEVKYEIEEFYKLPVEDRLRYKVRPGDVEGYGQTVIHSAHQKVDWADRFYIITNPVSRRKPHLFPLLPMPLREGLETYLSALANVSKIMLGLIAEALKIGKTEIQEMFEDGMQSIRVNYYPPCPEPDKVIGLTPHSDADGITILLQVNGVEGFQIKKNGVWMPTSFLPEAFVITLGDVIEILSNGVYRSVEHRAVVNSEKERISIAMFFNPKFQAEVGPAPALLAHQKPIFKTLGMEKYVTYFFSQRLNGKTFLDYMKI
ncbi:protein SRG1-like [Andrographis paniculata]|uniref:protein SRG1-like n=1 Tax=Andrographis paniculata TaxID=175694 RepID=UPI0021E88204|nr:protein SRG1-like [Andrographis paniculata]